ncbi:hypothetical protein LCGC14_1098190 [marine sediment metagenome]|uniref:DNA 5'-3' helicase n=1 Tax=marine sediment metagenome TaxID=412755 RepID=A0A0F9MY72_9ZZZZ|nr:hypothetical protein [bacterium]
MKKPSNKYNIERLFIQQLIVYPEFLNTLNIKPEHFYHNNFRVAFEVLEKMNDAKEKIVYHTLFARLAEYKGVCSEIALDEAHDFTSYALAETNLKILAEECAKRKIWKQYNKLGDAPLEFIAGVKKIELEFVEQKSKPLGEVFKTFKENYAIRKEKLKSKGSIGLITGFSVIDDNCPFDEGHLVILAAKTSVGKTALALNIAVNAAMFKQKALFFSAEMTLNELMTRTLAQLTRVSSTKFKYANADHSMAIAENEIKACEDNLSFIEAGGMTSDDICRVARQENDKIDLIVVDYVQYLKDRVEKGGTNNDRIGNIVRNLKGLAMELGCTVLALSQVNRATTDAPQLHNLRDSGNLEQDADAVLILHRESKEDTIASLVVAKNRNGKIVTDGKLMFKPELTKFYEKD